MGTEVQVQPTRTDDRNTPEYLAQLLKDKKQIQAFPNVFIHLERILDEEITKVRGSLFHFGNVKECLSLPEANGQIVTLQEKLFVPMKEHPEFNFVGRILGPRGMTAKQLEQETQCKIMVRGKGSMRDKKKEELNRGKPNWEHLSEDLHVLITVEDTRNRAEIKLKRAVEEVKKLLVPAPEGEDDLKKRQLMELAILNGTYRDTKASATSTAAPTGVTQTITQGPRILAPGHMGQFGQPALRSPTPAGAPIIFTAGQPQMPRLPTLGNPNMPGMSAVSSAALANLSQGIMSMNGIPMSMSSMNGMNGMNGGPPPLVSPSDAGLFVNMSQYAAGDPYALATSPLLAEYSTGLEQNPGAAVGKVRRLPAVNIREHPYTRMTLS